MPPQCQTAPWAMPWCVGLQEPGLHALLRRMCAQGVCRVFAVYLYVCLRHIGRICHPFLHQQHLASPYPPTLEQVCSCTPWLIMGDLGRVNELQQWVVGAYLASEHFVRALVHGQGEAHSERCV